MKVAITGPTGAIGSELVRLLLDNGHEVIAVIRPGSKKRNNLPESDRLKIIESDISEYNSIEDQGKCDLFYHLAWKETFGAERDNALLQVENVRHSVEAVQLAYAWGAKVFIGTGSQAEYGPTNQKLGSQTPVNPESGYGIAKYAAGKMCNLACQQLGIRFNWARVVSVYGDRDSDYTLIMYLIHTLLDGGIPELTKCEQIWDYMYSKDAARALYAIGLNGKPGKTYVLGSGNGRALKDYVLDLKNVVNSEAEIKFGAKGYYPHQPMMLCADLTELTEDTGFIPKYTFEEGIHNIIGFMQQNGAKRV